MRFKITNNNGTERFVAGKSNEEGDEIEKRLNTVQQMGKIKRFERLDFDRVTPDDILKAEG